MKPTDKKVSNALTVVSSAFCVLGFFVFFSFLNGCTPAATDTPATIDEVYVWSRIVMGLFLMGGFGSLIAYLNTED